MSATSSIGQKILWGIAVAGALLAWQLYDRSSEAKKTRAEMVEMCGGEENCIATVNKHAEHCFSENYKFGKRSGIDMDKFVACVNEQAGEELFVSVPAE
jgi:hypothetical protein